MEIQPSSQANWTTPHLPHMSVTVAIARHHRAMSATAVVLNVGGTKFYTSETTLRSPLVVDGSYLSTLDLSKGEIFIDRDPTVFGYVLNYLRDGRVIFPDDGLTTALLFQEAKVRLLFFHGELFQKKADLEMVFLKTFL
ncbi:unnamed protein product [Heligmosomoides polygyrus]|uniref:BTB domain-containing protein n=1 Tax=Heligmosomoides polygyrus TaxID=6339 RepID=A0A183FA16_HELPZ|nr:unnamed protein product [Heligmosomoides polygyrus]